MEPMTTAPRTGAKIRLFRKPRHQMRSLEVFGKWNGQFWFITTKSGSNAYHKDDDLQGWEPITGTPMPSGPRDDWEKPRSKGTHLTDDELVIVREGYRTNRGIKDVARELKCSSRTITKYYGLFGAEGLRRGSERPVHRQPNKARFYTSNFEPT